MKLFIILFSSFAMAKDDSLAKIQKSLDGFKTLETSFTQTVKSKVLGTTEITKGKVFVSKPGSIRWESENLTQILTPEAVTMVRPKAQRGKTVVDIYPKSQQQESIHLNLLLGSLKLEKAFECKAVKFDPFAIGYKCKPKEKSKQGFIAAFDRPSYQLRAISFESDDSKTDVVFSEIKLNNPIDAALFEYRPSKEHVIIKH